jgi:cell division protein ZapA
MTAARNVVKVSILDEEFAIRSEATAEHTVAVAEHVDRTIRQILSAGGAAEARKAAILAALQITDELLKARATAADVTASLKQLSEEIRPWLPPAKR